MIAIATYRASVSRRQLFVLCNYAGLVEPKRMTIALCKLSYIVICLGYGHQWPLRKQRGITMTNNQRLQIILVMRETEHDLVIALQNNDVANIEILSAHLADLAASLVSE